MKNLIIVLTVTLFTLFSFTASAQIEVISNGNVGIGTSSPSAKLDVNGVLKTYEVRSKSSTFLTLRTNHGYLNIGPGNASYSHFITDRARFYFNKLTYMNGNFLPYSNNTRKCGSNDKRWNKGYFTQVYRVTEHNLSDRKVKENFRTIENPLSIIKKLDGQLYDYLPEVFMPETNVERPTDDTTTEDTNYEKLVQEAEKDRIDHYGFIAQDVKKILPNIVELDEETGLHSVSYTAIIPILVEAIKEQQKQIEELKKQINKK